jgi:Spy/CpxP family protein refolding chaperone
MKTTLLVTAAILVSAGIASAGQHMSYAGEEQREIKTLSAEEVKGYLAGKGAGLAKAAELNHYPGPAHAMEHADALRMTQSQRERTEKAFSEMRDQARRLGESIVGRERELDRLFANSTIDEATLRSILEDIGRLQADLRRVHLQAHLEQKDILTPEQVARYDELRGYVSGKGSHDQGHPRGH